LQLKDFDYAVPEHLVAQEPSAARGSSRLLLRERGGALRDAAVADLPALLPANALLVLNDSRVFPSRLFGRLATGAKIELFLLEPIAGASAGEAAWRALGRPLRKLRPGTSVELPGGVHARVLAKSGEDETGTATVDIAFDRSADALQTWLDEHGLIPLPPYIKRAEPLPAAASPDRDRYQTVYARERGSVAAPTAGLHFTDELLGAVARRGVEVRTVCLHVGGGTFLPVKTEDLTQHRMHSERVHVPRATLEAIVAARHAGRPIVAIGTTTFRSLETLALRAAGDSERLVALGDQWHSTDLFIYPRDAADRYRPALIDGLITNFHQPQSTLYMLIAALLGLAEARRVYAHAIAAEYRLFSYGDASLLWLD
jgi:S-adenosylmethionine:tRNA ribosyltransferase-isomerase